MNIVGFSTGALAKGNLALGVDIATELRVPAIELSALRYQEVSGLVRFAASFSGRPFKYVSVHAPSSFPQESERSMTTELQRLCSARGWPVVVHPDSIFDLCHWAKFGELLCIENMDSRKQSGRSLEELQAVLAILPRARVCFDIAHARQVDTSMTEAYRLLVGLGDHVCQIHLSEVISDSRHARLSNAAISAYQEVADVIPNDVPIILESPVNASEAQDELERANLVLTRSRARRIV
jgi:hypothetical protein